MQARDVMVHEVISVGPDTPVQAAAKAMISNGVSAVVVLDIDARLIGLVSEGDLVRRVETDTERRRSWWLELFMSTDSLAREFVRSHARRVSDVMTREVITAAPDSPLREIADLMEKHGVKRVPIVDDGEVVGIVSRANLLQALAGASSPLDVGASDRVLRQRIVDGIRDKPWASRPFNVMVEDGHADLCGFVFSRDEKAAIRVAVETTAGIDSVADHLRVVTYLPSS